MVYMISRRLIDWLCVRVIEVWRLTPLSKIFQLYRGAVLLVEKTRVPGKNHRPNASHWQTLLHVVSSTPRHDRAVA